MRKKEKISWQLASIVKFKNFIRTKYNKTVSKVLWGEKDADKFENIAIEGTRNRQTSPERQLTMQVFCPKMKSHGVNYVLRTFRSAFRKIIKNGTTQHYFIRSILEKKCLAITVVFWTSEIDNILQKFCSPLQQLCGLFFSSTRVSERAKLTWINPYLNHLQFFFVTSAFAKFKSLQWMNPKFPNFFYACTG